MHILGGYDWNREKYTNPMPTRDHNLSNVKEEKVENIWIENVIIVLHVLAKSLVAIRI